MKLISVLMPTYNVEKFIGAAIESILTQTWKNFELIIVDDCSTDHTYDILKEYAAKDSRIQLYKNEINSKICKTLNKALYHAKGEFIVRMDGDDVSLPDRFERLYQFLVDNPQVDLVGSNVITIDEDGKEIGRKSYIYTNEGIKRGNKYMPCIAHIWMAKKKVYEELSGYRDIPYAEDYDFLLRGELKGFKYANIEDFVYCVRIRNGNTGSSNGLVQRKTANYVKLLHKQELKSQKDEFSIDSYKAAIYCTEKEKEKFMFSAQMLLKAIMNKNNVILMLFYALVAACTSKYEFQYLLDSLRIRMIAKYMK